LCANSPNNFAGGSLAHLRGRRMMRISPAAEPSASHETESATHLPMLLTIDEAADLLRTSRRAIYAMIARRQLLGIISAKWSRSSEATST
jgi:hypothetical protein